MTYPAQAVTILRTAIDSLYSNLFMYSACDLKTMPDKSGVSMQVYDHSKMAANTTAVTEGTPFAGQAITQNVRTLNLANFADFISLSSKVKMTSISDDMTNASALLGYRGALSVDTVVATAVDAAATADAATVIDIANGTFLNATAVRKAVWQLRSLDIKPKDNGLFLGICPSLQVYDLINEGTATTSAAGSFTDLQKFADTLAPSNPALVGIKGALVGNLGGALWYESNALPFDALFQSGTTNGYHAYIFGKNSIFASSLGSTALGQKNFQVVSQNFPMGSNSLDPTGLIASAVAYNFWLGVVKRPGSTNGFRRIRSESSIG